MTLIVALECDSGVVLAGDSCTTGDWGVGALVVQHYQQKIFKLSKFAGIGAHGAVDFMPRVVTGVQYDLSSGGDDVGVTQAARRVREAARQVYGEWFGNLPDDKKPVLGISIAGYDVEEGAYKGKPFLYHLSSPDDFLPKEIAGMSLAGILGHASYIFGRYYKRGMSIDGGIALAIFGITEMSAVDPRVGGPVQIATIKPDNGFKMLSEDKLKDVFSANSRIQKRLADFFK